MTLAPWKFHVMTLTFDDVHATATEKLAVAKEYITEAADSRAVDVMEAVHIVRAYYRGERLRNIDKMNLIY